MSDRERKNIFSEPVPGSPKIVKADICYRKDARVRGYYFFAIVVEEKQENGYTSTSWAMGEGSKSYLIEQTNKFNAKRLAQLMPSDELIATVRAESLASIRVKPEPKPDPFPKNDYYDDFLADRQERSV